MGGWLVAGGWWLVAGAVAGWVLWLAGPVYPVAGGDALQVQVQVLMCRCWCWLRADVQLCSGGIWPLRMG
jgi:hypothetical protein